MVQGNLQSGKKADFYFRYKPTNIKIRAHMPFVTLHYCPKEYEVL